MKMNGTLSVSLKLSDSIKEKRCYNIYMFQNLRTKSVFFNNREGVSVL